MNTEIVQKFHQEHLEALSQLSFYEDEINFYKATLDSILEKCATNLSILDQVNEYQDIFQKKIYRLSAIRLLIRDHQKRENKLNSEDDLNNHKLMKKELNKFVADLGITKKAFKRFASKYG